MPILRLILILSAFAVSACTTTTPIQTSDTTKSLATLGNDTETSNPSLKNLSEDQSFTGQHSQSQPVEKSYKNIWLRISDNLVLERHLDNQAVKERIAWYSRNQEYFDRVAKRATPYFYHIVEELMIRDIPLDIALLPIVESAFQPFAYSRSRASGIWQFISSTGKHYGLKQNWWYDGRRDILASTEAALNYLEKLHSQFDGDWQLALAAYNSGELNVGRAISRNQKLKKKTDFFSLKLPSETRNYVPSLLALAEIVANPEKHGITLTPINNTPYFTKVDIGKQLDLSIAAKFADLTMDEIYILNPGFNRWATDPDGPYYLLVPIEKEQQFVIALAALPESERVSWHQHVIKRGETLSQIAERYHTSIVAIKDINNLRNNTIRIGHSLLIPSSKQQLKHYTLSIDSRRFSNLQRDGNGEKYIYTAIGGDNLWLIGEKYGVSISELSKWNGIRSSSIIRPGQKLSPWLGERTRTTLAPAIKIDYSRNDSGEILYTVKKGDSLWQISRQFRVTVAQLQEWNNLNRDRFLQLGQKLILHDAPLLQTGG